MIHQTKIITKMVNLFTSVQHNIPWKFCTRTVYVVLDVGELHVALNFHNQQNLTYDNTEKTSNSTMQKKTENTATKDKHI